MRTLTSIAIKWPWLTIGIVLVASVFFGVQLKDVRIDNEIKEFLPEQQADRQQFFRSLQVFGGESLATIGISVAEGGPHEDIFNQRAIQIIDELTDWLRNLEIESSFEYAMWVKPEQADAILKQRSERTPCTPKQIEKANAAPIPADLQNHVKLWICKAPRKLPLDDVVSLATTDAIFDEQTPPADGEGEVEHALKIQKLWSESPKTRAELDRVRELVKSWDFYRNQVVSPPDPKDGKIKSASIYAFLPDGVTIEYSEKLQKLIDEKVASLDKPDDGLVFHTGGMPFLSVWIGRYMQSDLAHLIPFVLLVVLVVLTISFRNFVGVSLPFITVSLGTVWTVGLSTLLHKPLTVVTSAIPTLITAVGSAYTIHVVHHYFEERRAGVPNREAMLDSMDKVGLAVVMAGLTTVGGFFSLSSSSVVPIRDFGYLSAFGALACLAISVTFAPAVLVVWFNRKAAAKKDEFGASEGEHDPARGPLGAVLSAVSAFVSRRKAVVGLLAVLVLATCGYGASRLQATINLIDFFLKDSEIRKMDDYLRENFGGTALFYVTIDGQETDYWKEPERLQKIDELVEYVKKKHPDLVGQSTTVNDYLKKMWMALHYDDPAYHVLPDSRQGVSDCLFMFSMSSDSLKKVVDTAYQRVRVSFKLRNGQSMIMGKVKRDIDHWMEKNMPEMLGKPSPAPTPGQWMLINLGLANTPPETVGAHYHFSGENFIQYAVDRLVVTGQMRSLTFSIIIVFLLCTFIFRSLVGGLLSIVPIVVTVLANFAIMGFGGIPLDLGTALVANAAVGCGIDYAIHYINRYRVERSNGKEPVEAARETHLTSGKAVIFNATAVALGFFVLIFSNFNPIIRLGVLTGLTMFIASFTALTVLPPLLLWLRPRFIRRVVPDNK